MHVFFIPIAKRNNYQELLINGLNKLDVKVHSGPGFNSFEFQSLIKTAFDTKIKIIHIHWLDPFIKSNNLLLLCIKNTIFLLEIYILQILGKKIVWTAHNILPHETSHSRLLHYFTRNFIKNTDAVIVHSLSAKNTVATCFQVDIEKITVIPHGNYIEYFINNIDKKKARNELDIPDSNFVILTIGQIRPYKGIDKLIHAVNNIGNSSLQLIIAGHIADKSYYNHLLDISGQNKNISIFNRYIPDDKIQYYMNSADIVALPYTNILSSGVSILAMSFAKPIIAPYIGDFPELFKDKGGILYDPDKSGDLERAIKFALTADIQEMGRINYERVLEFDWLTSAEKTKEIYFSQM